MHSETLKNVKRFPYLAAFFCVGIFTALHSNAQDVYNLSQPDVLISKIGYNQKAAVKQSINSISGEGFMQYALNNSNAISTYIPWLYNMHTNSWGVSDLRIRYVSVIKRDISPGFLALQCGMQVTIPSGSKELGLGSGRLLFQPFVTGILRFSQRISFMPTVSYIHYTSNEPKTQDVYSTQGLTLSPNLYYRLNDKVFLSAGAGISYLSSRISNTISYSGNCALSYVVKKWQLTAGCSANFINKSSVLSAGVFYLL